MQDARNWKVGKATLVVAGALVLATGLAQAATFPGTDTAGADEVVTINAGGGADYTSLAAAATAFNAMTTGMQRNWTIEIASDLTETANISIANTTNGFTLTIKPAASTSPTVTFTQTTDNSGPSGHLVFGSGLAAYTPVTMSGVIVDGSNNGSTSRNLTLTNTAATSFPNSRLIRVVGNCDNFQIKNLILTNRTTTGNSAFGVDFTSRNDTVTNFIPDNNLVKNCAITITTGTACQGIGCNISGTISSGTAQTGLVIEDNTITARTRGIYMNNNAGVTIRRNTISVNQTASGLTSYGIYLQSDNASAAAYTIDINNNDFAQLASANTAAGFGMMGINLEATGATGSAKTVTVYNNILRGFSMGSGTPADVIYRGISVGSTNATVTIEHNSVHMPDFPVINNTTVTRAFGIGMPGTPTASWSMTLRNNAIHYTEAGGFAVFRGGTLGTFTSVGNNLYTGGTANKGRVAGTVIADMTAWQTAGYDTGASNGQEVDFFNTTPSNWTSALKWTGSAKPTGVLGVANRSAFAAADIDGDTRLAVDAYPGADEFAAFALPVELDSFSVD